MEIVRLGGRNVLYLLCARCLFEYNFQDLLGACAGIWMELWRRILADGPPLPPPSSTANCHNDVRLGQAINELQAVLRDRPFQARRPARTGLVGTADLECLLAIWTC